MGDREYSKTNFGRGLENNSSLCYHCRMNNKPWKLAHKKPVTEQEFLTHLYKICSNTYVRSLILSYYKKLKSFDHKYGKQISIQSYGLVPFSGPYGDSLPDQAKHLFGAKPSQKLLVEAVETIGEKACKIFDKASGAKDFQTEIIKARNAFLLHFLKTNSKSKIGKAELFRWQFVNLINQMEITEKEVLKGAGTINFIKRKTAIHNIVPLNSLENPDKILEKYYTDKSTVFHELTHLMAVKTFSNGFYNYLIDYEFQDQKGLFTALPVFLKNTPNKSEALAMYSKGLTILIELATELFTSVCISNITSAKSDFFFDHFKNCPTLQTVHLQSIKDNNYVVHSEYQFFGHLLQLVMVLNNFDNKDIIAPNNVPTQNMLKMVEQFFEEGSLSPQIASLVDSIISKKFGIGIDEVKQSSSFQKFVLLLGITYQNFEASLVDSGYFEKTKNLNSAYDKNAMLLQAMILDIHKNKFETAFKKIDNPKTTKKFLATYARLASFADDWVIKPNISYTKNNQTYYLRHQTPNTNLALMFPENIALSTWADFLKVIVSKTQKFAPEVFEKNNFLNREKNYLNELKNNYEK